MMLTTKDGADDEGWYNNSTAELCLFHTVLFYCFVIYLEIGMKQTIFET